MPIIMKTTVIIIENVNDRVDINILKEAIQSNLEFQHSNKENHVLEKIEFIENLMDNHLIKSRNSSTSIVIKYQVLFDLLENEFPNDRFFIGSLMSESLKYTCISVEGISITKEGYGTGFLLFTKK